MSEAGFSKKSGFEEVEYAQKTSRKAKPRVGMEANTVAMKIAKAIAEAEANAEKAVAEAQRRADRAIAEAQRRAAEDVEDAKAQAAFAASAAAERSRREARQESKRIARQEQQARRNEIAAKQRRDREFEEMVPREVRETLPANVLGVVKEIVADPQLNGGVEALMGRERDFPTSISALLSGIALLPESATKFSDALDAFWGREEIPLSETGAVDEVVIGSGLHGAIYASVRKQKGFNPPLILEAGGRAGGTFAVSKAPSFYMNSRNRPGQLGLPGQDGAALNVIPASPVQPAELRGEEYLSNDVLAWTIRSALAMSGSTILTGEKVISIGTSRGAYAITLDGRASPLFAKRVIIATGLANRRVLTRESTSPRILSFEDLMRKMDEPFPFRGMRNVAVVGAGDSGKTAIEALTGQGPTTRWSVAAVDWINKIDWYGCQQANRTDWENCNRSRYKRIGKLLPNGASPFRVKPMPKASMINDGYDCVYVDERPYDCVVQCLGFTAPGAGRLPFDVCGYSSLEGGFVKAGERDVGRFVYNDRTSQCFVVGPASNVPLNDREALALGAAAKVMENLTSIFRYAPRTAALAASLK